MIYITFFHALLLRKLSPFEDLLHFQSVLVERKCVLSLCADMPAPTSRAHHGPKLRARSPVACDGRRRFSGRWASSHVFP